VIALSGIGRRLHLAQEGVHLLRPEAAPGPDRAVAAHARQDRVETPPERAALRRGDAALLVAAGLQGVENVCDEIARRGTDQRGRHLAHEHRPRPERLDSTFASWTEHTGEVEPLLTLAGRVNDLVIVDRPDPEEPFTGRALDTALFSVGRPTLMIGQSVPADLLSHVVIAWNGSLEATRLIGQSITLLHEAGRVTVVHAETGRRTEMRAADLSAYLRWHGIVAESMALPVPEGMSVGAAILGAAEAQGASMLALGAYTHSRVRELLLGGVTRHVIENARMPVLMGH